ncbi:MAG TPA: class I SAM-dependent methyltransferase [Phycisphaerales bacterium]|nr:class I SAM-dependent methyltransferase [Phycisphaerales bacterium]
MQRSAYEYFGAMVESYDSLIRRAVPRYAEMTDRLMEYLLAGTSPGNAAGPATGGGEAASGGNAELGGRKNAAGAGRGGACDGTAEMGGGEKAGLGGVRGPRAILELGCGTGNLTIRLAERFPGARITFVDASEEMVSLTGARLAERGNERSRVEPTVGRFEELQLGAASFDAVTSCISLHHVRDKPALFRAIRGWLAPGGLLAFADQMAGATEENHRVNWEGWLQYCREPGNCTEEEIASLVAHAAAHDHYESVGAHFDAMRLAGFEAGGIDCVWRNLMWAIVTARA